MLDERYAAEKLTLILTSAVAEAWSLSNLAVSVVTASLHDHDVPEVVVRALLSQYGRPVTSESGPDDNDATSADVYALDADRICRFEAVKLLRDSPVRHCICVLHDSTHRLLIQPPLHPTHTRTCYPLTRLLRNNIVMCLI